MRDEPQVADGARASACSDTAPCEPSARDAGQATDQPPRRSSRHGSWGVLPREVPADPWIALAACTLLALGLVMVYSASAWLGREVHGDFGYFFRRQAAFAGLGLVAMLAASRADYRVLRRFAPHLMLVVLVLLVAVLFTREINGARRWLRLGPVNLQPSELAKIALAVFLSALLARQGERVRSFRLGFLPIVTVSGISMLLVLLERDLGTTILLGVLTVILLFVAGTRLVYVVAGALVAAPIVWSQIVGVAYRRARLEEFLESGGYQVRQALIAVGSGGWTGLGIGEGRQKLGFLPENHTDFILATIGEELGLLGIGLVVLCFAVLVVRGFVAARYAPDRFGTYLAIGLSSLFGLQVLVNMAVVLDVIPAKGITLPLLSYGGSSLVASLAAVGILLSISRRPHPWRLSDQRGRRPARPTGGRRGKTARRNVRRPRAEAPVSSTPHPA
ncbi:MAG: putative lipid II flippase FtsW [Deltaproteobacteria bacterium]|nr:MAG: putative lipid II flippase FtsW [Deltaproteobacteria bacterium]